MGNNDPEKVPDGRHFRRLAILFFILVPAIIIAVIMGLRFSDSRNARADSPSNHSIETTPITGDGEGSIVKSQISLGQTEAETKNTPANSEAVKIPDGTELNPEAPDYITELFNGYFQAKLGNDAALVNSYFTGGGGTDPEEESRRLLWSLEYIEDYRDITCYTIPGPAEDSMIVYTAYKIKFYQSEIPASSLSVAYVVKDGNGVFKIFEGTMEEDLKEYMEQAAQLDSVKALDRQVQEAFMQELLEDENLAEIYSIAMNMPKTLKEPSDGQNQTASAPSQTDGKTGDSES